MRTEIEIINEVQRLRYKISKQKELIDYYEQMSHSLGGNDLSSERVDCTRNLEAPFVRWIYKKIEAQEKLNTMESDLVSKLDKLSMVIERLESHEYQMVLNYRYVMDLSWDEIPTFLNYSKSSVFRLHREALQELEMLIVNDSE